MLIDLKKVLPRNIRGRLMDFLSFLPDKPYLQLFYYATTGRIIHFKNPTGYGEKLQWLKIYDKHPEYSDLVDKIKVREIVREKLGKDCSFPVLGVWEAFSEIDFSKLPNDVVLKCNHDSGSVKRIHNWFDYSEKEKKKIEKFYTRRLKDDFFYSGREYPYKGIKPLVFAEPLMESERDREAGGIKDYKFFCFNGEPKLLLMVSGRQSDHCEDFFDMDYRWIPELRTNYHSSLTCPPKPDCFETMKEYARILSKDIRHVRMDFYELDGQVYFGEYTFFEGGGFELISPEEWDLRMASWIDLDSPKIVRKK